MRLRQLDEYFRETLRLSEMDSVDNSLNGIQVECSDKEIGVVAFGVDACRATFERAAEVKADLLFVHHGLFWGKPLAVTRSHYRRIKFLLDRDMGLYAAHLPLDVHPELGNNAGLAQALRLSSVEPFGDHRGRKIGLKGRLPASARIDDVLRLMGIGREECAAVLPFGPRDISTVGVVSGKALIELEEAILDGLDLYITGEASHQVYHLCLEEGMNLICAGHYRTEVWGVHLLSQRLSRDTGIATIFVDVPTGL